ncbi:hypothetical protein [Paenibacillus polymyxa]|uniref:Uncharacterized protein n=1 Tax=Paenibacillus polymyxa TaxID=1406 RepID=A0ABX2ZAB1_PAEPO|nr:hypothetical protein [Paenibacillus polymyxa]ODA08213.1 hypothetical protein A7312_28020 [Paenibacillus polymyxa]
MEIVHNNIFNKVYIEAGDILITDYGNHILVAFDDNSGMYCFIYLDEGAEIRYWSDSLDMDALRGRKIVSIVKSVAVQLVLN